MALAAYQVAAFCREGVLFPRRALASDDALRRAAALQHFAQVRGEDRFGHWDADPRPAGDDDPAIEAFMRSAFERYRDQEAAAAA